MTADITMTIQKAREHSIGDLLRRSAQRDPNKTAVICGDVTWTFAEMDAACNRLGRGLLGLGIGKGDRVAVLSRNSHAFAALRFAIARIGAILVPINFMLNPDEINFILANSGAKLLATGPDFVEAAQAATAKGSAIDKLVWLPGEDPAVAPAGITTFDDLLCDDAPPLETSVDSRDPAHNHLYQRDGVAAEGRHPYPRSRDVAVCQLHHRRRDGGPGQLPACAAALSLRAA